MNLHHFAASMPHIFTVYKYGPVPLTSPSTNPYYRQGHYLIFTLFLPFLSLPLSLHPFERSQTMDRNGSNAHCAPCADKSDWLTEGSDCKAATPATSAMNGLNH